MSKITLKDKLQFDNSDLTAPDVVMKEIVDQIQSETEGIITGNIESYDKPVVSYSTSIGLEGLQSALGVLERNNDIQKLLGKQGEELAEFEFYLTTPVFDQYEFRICFFEYGVANYPVKVVLEQGIADEVNKKGTNSNYIFICNNRCELEELIIKVLYTNKVIGVMQELIHIYQIHKHDET